MKFFYEKSKQHRYKHIEADICMSIYAVAICKDQLIHKDKIIDEVNQWIANSDVMYYKCRTANREMLYLVRHDSVTLCGMLAMGEEYELFLHLLTKNRNVYNELYRFLKHSSATRYFATNEKLFYENQINNIEIITEDDEIWEAIFVTEDEVFWENIYTDDFEIDENDPFWSS